jgi:hypothetical protein
MKNLYWIIFLLAVVTLSPVHLSAWDGYDYDTDNYIEIDNPGEVVPGNDVVIYDYDDESYHEVYVISVDRNGDVMVEVFDYDRGDYRTFEMTTPEGEEQDREVTLKQDLDLRTAS